MFCFVAFVAFLGVADSAQTSHEANIKFIGYTSTSALKPFVSTYNTSMAEQGCDPNGNFTIILHGWEKSTTDWMAPTIRNFLKERGNCLFFMDFFFYSKTTYGKLFKNFAGISNVLLKKVKQIGNYENQLIYGFSIGARLAVDVGIKISSPKIGRLELCEPAGPLFEDDVDPKRAAKNVACINTSTDIGTDVYNCHQNFRMGYCGKRQPGAGRPPVGSHGLCPYFYNLAFNFDFVPYNYYKCSSPREIKNVPANVRMGFNADFDRTKFIGDIFIATAKNPPFIVKNGKINNPLGNLTLLLRL